jgi:hypothetical protein
MRKSVTVKSDVTQHKDARRYSISLKSSMKLIQAPRLAEHDMLFTAGAGSFILMKPVPLQLVTNGPRVLREQVLQTPIAPIQ